jgi:hypothetical protein
MIDLKLSDLPKTWFIDIDGVVFRHNGYKTLPEDEYEELLPGIAEFFSHLGHDDTIILCTSRTKDVRARTEASLDHCRLRYDQLLMGLPVGERIVINDIKPRGLETAVALNVPRDKGMYYE